MLYLVDEAPYLITQTLRINLPLSVLKRGSISIFFSAGLSLPIGAMELRAIDGAISLRPTKVPYSQCDSLTCKKFSITAKASSPEIKSSDLLKSFSNASADLSNIRRGITQVPNIFLTHFPVDLPTVVSVNTRKDVFIKTVLPLILKANIRIRRERERLIRITESEKNNQPVKAKDIWFIADLGRRYGVNDSSRNELLRRVDSIPPSLALAQGAEESGWGTSRFAHQGNAVFGQRTFTPNRGIVPNRRAIGQIYEVRRFKKLYTSVVAYIKNLNTHSAYTALRQVRALARQNSKYPNSLAMASTLTRYSERGPDYVRSIREILRVNELREFDTAQLVHEARNASLAPNRTKKS